MQVRSLPTPFQSAVPLRSYCTFGIGGPARWLAHIRTRSELLEALVYCHQQCIPWLLIGKGSNVFFDDAGFDGAILVNKMQSYDANAEGYWSVDAGFSFARLGTLTAKHGWSGLEFASAIPGSIGGAVYMNAGASGRETAEVLEEVEFIHPDGSITIYPRSALSYSYRTSPFQHQAGAIVSAIFKLEACANASKYQRSLLLKRTTAHPYHQPSAGCIFRNPADNSAGALIDACGLKGYRLGDAAVSTQHANFIVNLGAARAEDVLRLMQIIRETIASKYGIALHSEVRYIPFQGRA
jgi:UDP-N-acetylmuramate dehydrogenase